MKKKTLIVLIVTVSHCLYAQHQIIDSLQNILRQTNEEKDIADLYNKLSLEMSNRNTDSAIYFAKKGMVLSKKLNYKNGIADSYLSYGEVSIVEGKFNKAIDFLLNALKIYEKEKDSIGISKTDLKLGFTYYQLKNFDKAQKYNKKALSFLNDNNHKEQQDVYNNMGLVCFSVDLQDSALFYYQKSILLSKKKNSRKNILYELGNIANLYLNKGDYYKALEIYKEVRLLSEKHGDKSATIISFCNLSETNYLLAEKENKPGKSKKLYSESLSYGDSALFLAKGMNSLVFISYSYEQIFQAYKGLEDYEKAFSNFESYIEKKDSLYNLEKLSEMEKIENQYHTEKQQIEIASFKATKELNEALIKKQTQIIFTGLFAIIAILTLFFFLILLYRKKRKANRLLNKQNESINNQKNEIARQRDSLSELAFELKKTNKKKKNINKLLNEKNESILKQRREITEQRNKLSELAFELKKSNKTKNKFISVLAHDLKTPFQTILGFSELLKVQTAKEKLKKANKFSELIYNTALNTYTLLENLLEWAKSEAGIMKYRPENVILSDIIDESIRIIQNSAEIKNITIKKECDKTTSVFVDKPMIATVIRNVVSNAVKFTERNGKINIISEKRGDNINLIVKDSGIGIKKEKMLKLFKADQYISSTGTEKEQGTGLGLSVCKEFVLKNNGIIKVESKPGEGSTFIITLPKAKQN